MTIRPATHDDIGAVLELWASSRSAAAATPDTAAGLALLLERDPEALLVADVDGQIAGTLIGAFDGWRGGMYRLAVGEQFRRRGLGRELVHAAEESLQARGCRRISVLAGGGETDAHAFWQALGYKSDPGTSRFVKNVSDV